MNRLILGNILEDYAYMKSTKKDASTKDDNLKLQENTYLLNGYKVRMKYSEGKTFYDCMENVVKRLNDNLKYNIL